ncbi:Ig domain-containing protein [Acidovorax sp.]|uniref:Ig domain-containing protein n=1 Tax=Acidovorax sp. TaxID=1872122 RepID=UPI002ACDB22F|nr:Ig domain-containing protein [Acidovorax sp.]MDZ7865900.1 Ig domain-containing protein [Acidovorax sp.]
MKKLWKAFLLSSVAVLAACGGGGGSGGESNLQYRITLTTAKSQLPINIGNSPANIGAFAAYTTTLYVDARVGSNPIPGGEDIFACNIVQGLDTGALYYLDGDEEHEDDNGNQLPFRSIVLGANAGGASFHFHAGDQAGTARVVCSVTDPRDRRVYSASVDIAVGAATGKVSSVTGVAEAPGVLLSRDNIARVPYRNNIGVQAFVMDDANQPIPAPSAPNLQVSIRPIGQAAVGARLLQGNQSGSVLQVRTIGGVGLFSLSSGPSNGAIVLEYVTDRFDNDVTNGIQDPVTALHAVPVVDNVAQAPLTLPTPADQEATVGLPFAAVFPVQGGVGPYTWSAIALPSGLSISNDGIVSGVPQGPGSYSGVLTVVDSLGAKASGNVKFTVEAGASVPNPLTVNGCVSNGSAVCSLPAGNVGEAYLYSLSVTGGNATDPVVWTFAPTPLPAGLRGSSTGNSGVVSGTPTASCNARFLVTATRGSVTVTQQVSVQIGANTAACP